MTRTQLLLLPLVLFAVACKGDDSTDDSNTTDDSGGSGDDSQVMDDTGTPAVSFATDVWPILDENCTACHADDQFHPGYKISDSATAYTSLTTDTPDATDKGFTKYVVAGDPAASLLIDKLQATPTYGGERMPKGGELSATEIATITTWITEGAANN